MLDIATESSPRKASKELCARIYHTLEHGGHGLLPGAGPRAFLTYIHSLYNHNSHTHCTWEKTTAERFQRHVRSQHK